MIVDRIPSELRACNQWVVWKSIIRNSIETKPPFNPNHPQYGADVGAPSTWGTFEQAYNTWQANRDTIAGIGFVFTEDDDFFGLDIDDERKVKPEHVADRRGLVQQILDNVRTYTELSPSGQGLHLIGRGKLPFEGRRSPHAQIELYGSKRFFTITGNIFDGRDTITDQQQFADHIASSIAATGGSGDGAPVGDTDVYRRTDLSDDEVVRLATNFSPSFAPRFNAQIGCEPGEWSETFISVVGLLDRFTGSVEQIERIVMNSPMVLQAAPSSAGETRLSKAHRNFQTVLKRVRGNNTGTAYFVQHGYQQIQNIERAKAERAKAAAERIANAERAILSGKVMDAFVMLDPEHKRLTPPPGVLGEFVRACENACYTPFTKFAIPATISAIAGIIGRGYKLPNGRGINVNFILVAPSSTGKTQTSGAWHNFVADAMRDAEANSYAPIFKSHIVKNGAASIQGIYDEFMKMPSLCWMIDECASQLRSMANPTGNVDIQLRDAFNELYDVAEHGRYFTLPRSMSAKKADFHPINNCSVSTYWTTTPSKFDVHSSDALDGFLSRVTIIRHAGPAGTRIREQATRLDERLHSMLVALVSNAKRLDAAYGAPGQPNPSHEAASLITTVSTAQIEDLRWDVLVITDKIRDAALAKQLPDTYTAVSRLPITAERVAAIMAVLENPYTPAITPQQYLWAFGYVMQNTIALLGDMDAGELGQKASDETLTVVRVVSAMLKEQRNGTGSVLKDALRRRLMRNKPFSEAAEFNKSGSRWVSETIDHMIKEGMLADLQVNNKKHLGPTDDPIWTEL